MDPREALAASASGNDVYGAGLRYQVARLFVEAHRGANRERLEGAVPQAVAMKVDQAAVIRLDATEILLQVQLADSSLRRADARPGWGTPFAFVVLELAPRGPERVA